MAISNDLILESKALAVAIGAVTGYEPEIITYPDYINLEWTQEQIKSLQVLFENTMEKKGPPSPIRINFLPVVLPYGIKKAVLPVSAIILGLFTIGYLTGKYVK